MFSSKAKKSLAWTLLSSIALYSVGCTNPQTDTDSKVNEPTVMTESETATSEQNKVCQESTLVEQSGSNVYGVIEIGSSGVKAEVLQKLPSAESGGSFDLEPREEDVEPQDVDPIEPEKQAVTVAAVSDVFEEMQQRFAIPCEHIVIYGSSGFASKAPHGDALRDEVKAETGRNLELISEPQEAIYVFNAVVPPYRLNEVVMLDIGSGNTKVAYTNGSDVYSPRETFAIDFGTKSFTTAVKESDETQAFATAAEAAKETELLPEIQTVLDNNPEVSGKSRVYLAGGISWALTTLTRPCGADQQVIEADGELPSEFSPLSAEDINTFYINATRDQETLFSPDLSACSAERREKAEGDIELIRTKIFDEEQIISGAEILRALSSTMEFSDKEAIFFSSYAFEALPLGYLKQQIEASSSTDE